MPTFDFIQAHTLGLCTGKVLLCGLQLRAQVLPIAHSLHLLL